MRSGDIFLRVAGEGALSIFPWHCSHVFPKIVDPGPSDCPLGLTAAVEDCPLCWIANAVVSNRAANSVKKKAMRKLFIGPHLQTRNRADKTSKPQITHCVIRNSICDGTQRYTQRFICVKRKEYAH